MPHRPAIDVTSVTSTPPTSVEENPQRQIPKKVIATIAFVTILVSTVVWLIFFRTDSKKQTAVEHDTTPPVLLTAAASTPTPQPLEQSDQQIIEVDTRRVTKYLPNFTIREKAGEPEQSFLLHPSEVAVIAIDRFRRVVIPKSMDKRLERWVNHVDHVAPTNNMITQEGSTIMLRNPTDEIIRVDTVWSAAPTNIVRKGQSF